MLSLLKQHVRHLLRLDPKEYLQEMEYFQEKIYRLDMARLPRKGSLARKFLRCFSVRRGAGDEQDGDGLRRRTKQLRQSIMKHDELGGKVSQIKNKRQINRSVGQVTSSIYGVVALTAMPVIGVALMGFNLSWCNLPIELHTGMHEVLATATIGYYTAFFMIAMWCWDGNSLLAYVDFVISIIGFMSVWYWFVFELWSRMSTFDLSNFLILTGYMTFRCWGEAVKSRHRSFRDEVVNSGITAMEKMEFVWVTRSASLVSQVMPDIARINDALVQAWGRDFARRALRVRVYVTDKNAESVATLKKELAGTDLYEQGDCFFFHRPDLSKIIEDHSLDMVTHLRNSYTLLAFCGSPRLSHEIHQVKINNDITTSITGNKYHQMEFVSESYGGYKSKSSEQTTTSGTGGSTEYNQVIVSGAIEEDVEMRPAFDRTGTWRKTTDFSKTITDDYADEHNNDFEYDASISDSKLMT